MASHHGHQLPPDHRRSQMAAQHRHPERGQRHGSVEREMAERRIAGERPTRRAAAGATCTALALVIAGTLLAGCDHVGVRIPERPSAAFAPEFKGMWDYQRLGDFSATSDSLLAGILAIEGECALVIDAESPYEYERRTMLLLPRLMPRFRPSTSRYTDEDVRGLEHAIAWLPTLYDDDSQSLWVGAGERVAIGDRVSLSGWPTDEQREECDADWSWHAMHIEQWP